MKISGNAMLLCLMLKQNLDTFQYQSPSHPVGPLPSYCKPHEARCIRQSKGRTTLKITFSIAECWTSVPPPFITCKDEFIQIHSIIYAERIKSVLNQ